MVSARALATPARDLIVKQKTIRVLLDTGLSGDLLFIAKGSQKYIPTKKVQAPGLPFPPKPS